LIGANDRSGFVTREAVVKIPPSASRLLMDCFATLPIWAKCPRPHSPPRVTGGFGGDLRSGQFPQLVVGERVVVGRGLAITGFGCLEYTGRIGPDSQV
jgi:hypothetical protein